MDIVEYIKKKRSLTKILVVGSGAVGKTSLLKVLSADKSLTDLGDQFLEYHRTHFLELESISASTLDETSKGTFYFYDVAGQLDLSIHALRDTASTVMGSVDLVMLVFASDNPQSFLELNKWFSLVESAIKKSKLKKRPGFILIKNKIDLPQTLDESLIKEVINSSPHIKGYFAISCLTGEGLDGLKSWLITFIKEAATRE